MLTIRAEQMAALERDAEEKFLASAADFLRDEAPEVVEDATPEQIHDLAADCLRRARSYGIDDAHCVRQLILFTAWRGPGLYDEPWAQAILEDKRRSPLTRIILLENHLLSAMAEEDDGSEPE